MRIVIDKECSTHKSWTMLTKFLPENLKGRHQFENLYKDKTVILIAS
jgi:hypothetical protein